MTKPLAQEDQTRLMEASLWRDAIEALSEGIAIFDNGFRLLACNGRYREMFPAIAHLIVPGVHWDVLLRACVEEREIWNQYDSVDTFIAHARLHRVNFDREIVARHEDGRAYAVRFRRTQTGGWVVSRNEITERLRAEKMIADRDALLTTVLDTGPMAVTMARVSDGKMIYSSAQALALFGQRKTAGEHYADPKDRETYIEALSQQERVDGQRIRFLRRDGTVFEGLSSGRLINYDGESCVLSAITDLTEQLAREELLRYVMEACPEPIQMTDAESGEILFTSPATLALFGSATSARKFYVDPAQRDAYIAELREKRVVKGWRSRLYNREGEAFWGSVSARMIRYNGRDAIVSFTRDLTEELNMEAELEAQREAMHQNEKMSALGELMAGVAHELNNPLSVVVGHSLMLAEDSRDTAVLRKAEKIGTAAERCVRIVKTFLTMARQEPLRRDCLDMNEILQTAVDVASDGNTGSGVEVVCDLASDLPTMRGDADQLTQVFLNLILNAQQAIEISGTGDRITVISSLDDQGRLEVVVADNGPGIAPKHRGRVFDPFFTTKDVGVGTGIGLTLCHRNVTSHNGEIRLVDTGIGAGTAFRATLPRADEQPRSEPAPLAPEPTVRRVNVLIVDDEVDVAELHAEILGRAGYTVQVAHSSGAAISMLRDGAFDLIISDLNMPDIDGRGLFETLEEINPDLGGRIGYITGDTLGRASQAFLGQAERPYLEKPVSPTELRAFVRDILAGEGRGHG